MYFEFINSVTESELFVGHFSQIFSISSHFISLYVTFPFPISTGFQNTEEVGNFQV